jgi:hypothetical protein
MRRRREVTDRSECRRDLVSEGCWVAESNSSKGPREQKSDVTEGVRYGADNDGLFVLVPRSEVQCCSARDGSLQSWRLGRNENKRVTRVGDEQTQKTRDWTRGLRGEPFLNARPEKANQSKSHHVHARSSPCRYLLTFISRNGKRHGGIPGMEDSSNCTTCRAGPTPLTGQQRMKTKRNKQ